MSWIDQLKRRFSPSESGRHPPTATLPGQWTVSGIHFDASGWQLTESTSSRMVWTAPSATLVLSTEPAAEQRPPRTHPELCNELRATARENDEDIVLVEVVRTQCGQALQAVYKRNAGLGFSYRGVTELQRRGTRFRIESEIDEGHTTGIREAMVSAACFSCGELAFSPPEPDGSRTIIGFFHDAYDTAFDEGALNSVTDDERVDVIIPQHPLSRTRTLLRVIAASVALSEPRAGAALLHSEPDDNVSKGPRRQLAWSVVRSLYATAGRHDLMEQALEEELKELDEAPSLRLANSLMQLGMVRHMRDRPDSALPVLERAEEMFARLEGESAPSTATARAHHACALFKMGRRAESLPVFLDAIKVLEKSRPDDATYTLALANAAQLLMDGGEMELANEYLERAKQMMTTLNSSFRNE